MVRRKETDVLMSWKAAGIISIAAATIFSAGAAALSQPIGAKPAQDEPADDMEFKALKTVCGSCHTLALVTDRKRLESDWRRVFEKMARLGLPGTDDEIIAAGRYVRNHLTLPAECPAGEPTGGR